jgi:hypothetical protein
VIIRDATVAADYVASWTSFYQGQTTRPWPEVVQDVRRDVQAVIEQDGAFVVSGDLAAFVCRLPRLRRAAAPAGTASPQLPGGALLVAGKGARPRHSRRVFSSLSTRSWLPALPVTKPTV